MVGGGKRPGNIGTGRAIGTNAGTYKKKIL